MAFASPDRERLRAVWQRVTRRNQYPAGVFRNPVHFIAFGFGFGASRYIPGTVGTLAGIPLYWLLQVLPVTVYVTVVGALFAAGIWICEVTARDLGVHDHSGIVWDEVVGYLVTMTAAPAGWEWILIGFLVFRFFDTTKPWPLRALDRRVGGGFGIMLDDLGGGLYAWLVMWWLWS